MFHQRDGLFFDRQSDGAVRVVKTTDGAAPGTANVLFEQTIPVNEFASVVATMSADGEADGGFYRALEFLTLPWIASTHCTFARKRSDRSKWLGEGQETGMGRAVIDVPLGQATHAWGRAGGHLVGYDAVTVEIQYREKAVKPIEVEED